MDRRQFLNRVAGGVACATAGSGLVTGLELAAPAPRNSRSVVYHVKGFSCITCATGLEVMLLRKNGVLRASASYPDARVSIAFAENLISEADLRNFIASCGFTVD